MTEKNLESLTESEREKYIAEWKKIPKNIYTEVYESKELSIGRGNVESGKLNERNTGDEWAKFAKEKRNDRLKFLLKQKFWALRW